LPYWGLVVTSDSVKRGEKEDRVTQLVAESLARAGETLVYNTVAGNSLVEILYAIASALQAGAEIVLVTGGSGPGPSDVAADLAARLGEKQLPGIGEEFRRRSLEKGVANAVLSRASAYVFAGRVIVVSPGSPDAVATMLSVLLPVAGHLVEQVKGAKHHHGGHGH
jgi:molybdenum cofactor biosynthesis protein B